ncbi:MAG: AraC family transcriptional regulator [Clostridia bacterium]|nr:AraC family transcriptional regulator [Clostridia bacterium]
MNYANFINNVRDNTDFNIVQYGRRMCEPLFASRYFIRPTYLLHYVYEGCGYLEADGRRFDVKRNQAFLIFPGQLTTYVADKDDPFLYYWIEFYGNKAEEFVQRSNLSPANPIFSDDEPFECGNALKDLVNTGEMTSYKLTSMFWRFAATMVKNDKQPTSPADMYVERAKNYIHARVSHRTTVEEVAKHLSLNRSYFTRLFKAKVSLAPKQYILNYHMDVARSLLQNGGLMIREVADSVGYDSTVEFTKAFTRQSGIPPSKYKKMYAEHRERIKNYTDKDKES